MRAPRILLINPPSPEQLGTPLLGHQYVASAFLAAGCDVRIIDAAARFGPRDPDLILQAVRDLKPDAVGFGLFTRWIWHAYQLARRLRGEVPLLFAGGAHTTVRPFEVITQGFDMAVIGEAELVAPQIAAFLRGSLHPKSIPGVLFRDASGTIHAGPPAVPVADLDAAPAPYHAQDLYDSTWYDPSGASVVPGGILTSRGCPARCTFCANYVTGRKFRHRKAPEVVREINAFHDRSGTMFFPFWDDALTADIPRLYELCDAFESGIRFQFCWSAITRANMVRPELLRRMKQAGCVAVNFGVESGDDQILRQIKKGINTSHVVRALEWAKEEGLATACNFMVGFPQETPVELENTLRFMERIAPMVDSFSTMGVVVPFPGTELYETFHQKYGFTDWWLREECSHYSAAPPIHDFDRFYRHYIDDTNLELDFFDYSNDMRTMIRECLRYKGEHNLRKMGLLRDPVFAPVPVGA
jgi:anaerobic magnesium-protoporphyrin IX monomethyl ester cyclase